jgi:hypothetical protein
MSSEPSDSKSSVTALPGQTGVAETESSILSGFASLLGIPVTELRFGPRPAQEPPWAEPLDRATQPPLLAPDDARYDDWLLATLADLAEHFALAFSRAEMSGDARGARLRSIARILRATTLAAGGCGGDDENLERMGESAGRYLRAAAERQEQLSLPTLSYAAKLARQHRVPTRLYIDGSSCDPPFVLPAADVGGTPLELKTWLRTLMRSFLVRYPNPGSDPAWLRRIAGEMSDAFVGVLSGQRSLAAECRRPTDRQAVEDELVTELDGTPRWTTTQEVADALRAGPTPTSESDEARVSRIMRQMETFDAFAEQLVCAALRAVGFPRANGFYDYERKRVKKQAGA